MHIQSMHPILTCQLLKICEVHCTIVSDCLALLFWWSQCLAWLCLPVVLAAHPLADTVPDINFQGGINGAGHAQFPLRSGFYVVGDDPSQPEPANGGSSASPSTPSSCTSPPNSPALAAQPPPLGSSLPPPSISNFQNNQALFGRRLLQVKDLML